MIGQARSIIPLLSFPDIIPHKICSQETASMNSNPDSALCEIMVIRASAGRADGKVNLHDISRELV